MTASLRRSYVVLELFKVSAKLIKRETVKFHHFSRLLWRLLHLISHYLNASISVWKSLLPSVSL